MLRPLFCARPHCAVGIAPWLLRLTLVGGFTLRGVSIRPPAGPALPVNPNDTNLIINICLNRRQKIYIRHIYLRGA